MDDCHQETAESPPPKYAACIRAFYVVTNTEAKPISLQKGALSIAHTVQEGAEFCNHQQVFSISGSLIFFLSI